MGRLGRSHGAPRARYLSQEKAKAERVQRQLAGMLKSMPPKTTDARQLLIARQAEIVRVITRVIRDQDLLTQDRQRIVDTLARERNTLDDQLALLAEAGRIAP
jgi:hypothetical protein